MATYPKTTQYIGARYVPAFADPLEWSDQRTYEGLTIVTYNGDSYTSRKPVPVGIPIANTEFWAQTGNFNGQLNNIINKIEGWDDRIEEAEQTAQNAETVANAASKKVNDSLADYTQIKADVDEMKPKVAANEQEIATVREIAEQAQDDIATANTEIDGVKTRLDTAESSISGLTSKVQNNTAEINDLTTEIRKTKDQISGIQDSIGMPETPGTIKGDIKALQDRAEAQAMENTQIHNEIDTAMQSITAAQTTIAANTQAISDINQAQAEQDAKIQANADAIAKIEPPDLTALEEQVQKNTTAIGDANSGLTKAVTDNTAAINANKTAIESLEEEIGGGTGGSGTLTARVEALETSQVEQDTEISGLKTAVGDAASGLVKDVATLQTTVGDDTSGLVKQVADLEDAISGGGAGGIGERVTALETSQAAQDTKITTLETGVNGLTTAVGDATSGLTKTVNNLQTTVGDATAGLVKAVADNTTAIESLQEEIGGGAGGSGTLTKRVETLETSQTAQDGKITALETSQAAQDNRIDEIEETATSVQTTIGDSTHGLVKQVNDLYTTVGDASSGLVKDVNANMGDIAAAQADISTIQAQQTAQDTAISGVQTAIGAEDQPASILGKVKNLMERGRLWYEQESVPEPLNAGIFYRGFQPNIPTQYGVFIGAVPEGIGQKNEGIPYGAPLFDTGAKTYQNQFFQNATINLSGNASFVKCIFQNCFFWNTGKPLFSQCSLIDCWINTSSEVSLDKQVLFLNCTLDTQSFQANPETGVFARNSKFYPTTTIPSNVILYPNNFGNYPDIWNSVQNPAPAPSANVLPNGLGHIYAGSDVYQDIASNNVVFMPYISTGTTQASRLSAFYTRILVQDNTHQYTHCLFVGCEFDNRDSTTYTITFKSCVLIGCWFNKVKIINGDFMINEHNRIYNCNLGAQSDISGSAIVSGCSMPANKPSNFTLIQGWSNDKEWANNT